VMFHVPLKHKKKADKPGKRTIVATVTTNVKPAGQNKDKDKLKFNCTPCPTESCVPPTTTSTTTTPTSSTTTTTAAALPFCGDGVVNGTEACDPAAAATGCNGGDTCMPAGAISECTCKTCTQVNPVGKMQFVTSNATAGYCGDAALLAPGPIGTTSGSIT